MQELIVSSQWCFDVGREQDHGRHNFLSTSRDAQGSCALRLERDAVFCLPSHVVDGHSSVADPRTCTSRAAWVYFVFSHCGR